MTVSAWQEELSDAIDIDSHNPGHYTFRSLALLRQQNVDGALRDAQKAIALDPRSPRGYYRHSRALTSQRRLVDAGSALVHALALSPRDQKADAHFTELLSGIRRDRLYWQHEGFNARVRTVSQDRFFFGLSRMQCLLYTAVRSGLAAWSVVPRHRLQSFLSKACT